MNLLAGFSTERFSNFWTVLREVDPRSIENESIRPVTIVVCGNNDAGHRVLASELTSGALGNDIVDVVDMPLTLPVALPSADMYIYVVRPDRLDLAAARQHLWQLTKRSGVTLCAVNDGALGEPGITVAADTGLAVSLGISVDRLLAFSVTDRRTIQTTVAARIAENLPHLALALGRSLPTMRVEAARHLIRETARVNAEFAAVSSLPGIVPLIGGITAVGTDMVVLTKNQVMLLIKLAVIHHRSIADRWQLITEIAPVVGAAFMWRTAARALITLLPTPLAIAPKVTVAYVGTYVVGRAAEYYYQQGRRPPPDLLEGFGSEAIEHFRQALPVLTKFTPRLPRR